MRSAPVWGLYLMAICGCASEASGPPDQQPADAGADASADASSETSPDAEPPTDDAAVPKPDSGSVGGELCTSCGDCEESQRISSAAHVSTPINYTDLPPLGGDHAPCWTSYGVHNTEVLDERWVHNLEHGAVVLLYNCPEGCPDELARLTALAASRPFALVTPYAALPGSFAVVAWGHRLVSECFDEEAFKRFYEQYVDRAPESIPSDGSC